MTMEDIIQAPPQASPAPETLPANDGDQPAIAPEPPDPFQAVLDGTQEPTEPAQEPPVTPESAPEPPPQPPAPTQEQMDALTRRNQELESQASKFQEQALVSSLRTQFDQEVNQLIQQGVLPEQAQEIAGRSARANYQAAQAQQAISQEAAGANAKMPLAFQLAEKHGVDARSLMVHNSREEMTLAAASRATNNPEIAALRAEIEQLKKGQVPVQEFSSGASSSGGPLAGRQLEQAVGSGDVEMTPDVMKRLDAWYKSQGFGG